MSETDGQADREPSGDRFPFLDSNPRPDVSLEPRLSIEPKSLAQEEPREEVPVVQGRSAKGVEIER